MAIATARRPKKRTCSRTEVDGVPDRDGRTPLHYAALENRVSDLQAELGRGGGPNIADKHGFTPLHFAAQQSALDAASVLLDHGADVDAVNVHGNTPLWLANHDVAQFFADVD